MIKLLRNIKKYSVISIIASFILGILLIAFPNQCIMYTALVIGIALIALGIYALVSYFVKRKTVLLVYLGSLTILFGIIICVKFKEIVSLIILLCGIVILASGVTNLITGIKSIFSFKLAGGASIALSIASIVFGIIAVVNYSNLSEKIIMLIGVALLVFGITELVTYIEVMKLAKEVNDSVGDIADAYARIDSSGDTDIDIDATVDND